jgi:hypothetical protein
MMAETIMSNCIGVTITLFPVALTEMVDKNVTSILLAFYKGGSAVRLH